MTYKKDFPTRLTRVDTLMLPDHWHLTEKDVCYFLGEYTAKNGFIFSVTNDLISNLKKGVEKKGLLEWKYKERAILETATAFRDALPTPAGLKSVAFVPIPPSSAKDDPRYDDRLVRILQAIHPESLLDIRELLVQTKSVVPSHKAESLGQSRPGPAEIMSNYTLDTSLKEPLPKIIFVMDDVLTAGAHFRASKNFLSSHFPGVPVTGLFIARRVPGTTEITD